MKELIINSEQQKRYALSLIEQMKPDGKDTVIIKKTDMDPTAKQQRTHRMWSGEISLSGLGAHDDAAKAHEATKWQFFLHIFKRDETFKKIFDFFIETIKGSTELERSEKILMFMHDYVRTANLTRAERAEGLRDLFRYWCRKGVRLTDPNLMGLDLEKY